MLTNSFMQVTWVEHSEYDDSAVHYLLRPLLSSGFGFGAHRWVATLQRQSDCLAVLMSPNIPGEDNTGFFTSTSFFHFFYKYGRVVPLLIHAIVPQE